MKQRKPYGQLSTLVLAYLRDNGPATTAQVADAIGYPRPAVSHKLGDLHRSNSKRPQKVRIAAWSYEDPTGKTRKYLRPVYGLGRAADAPRPPEAIEAAEARKHWAVPKKTRRFTVDEAKIERKQPNKFLSFFRRIFNAQESSL